MPDSPDLDTRAHESPKTRSITVALLGLVSGLLLFGAGARFYFFLRKPLWADEIFTLWMARLGAGDLFAALRLDSGPPVHYLVAKLFLLPFPKPSDWDVIVRLPSLLASLLVLPLLVHLGKRLGNEAAGWGAAVLFAVSPLAVNYSAEGRAYAWASLLCLVAFERALILAEVPAARTAISLGVVAGLAFLSHYLTLFVLAGILGTFLLRHPARLKYWLMASGTAFAVVVPWIPVLLRQPRAAMEWEMEETFSSRAGVVFSNLMTGIQQDGPMKIGLLFLATALLGIALWKRKVLLAEPAGAVLLGFVLLLSGAAVRPEILLPERSAIAFLPLVFLAVASLGRLPAGVLAVVASGFLVFQGRTWTHPLPIQQIAEKLVPAFKDRHMLAVAGIWGPEINYWFERAGLEGRVRFFPAELERHPGWYSESGFSEEGLRTEAAQLLRSATAPDILVLPIGYRASSALRNEVAGFASRRIAATPLFEIIEVIGPPGSRESAGLPPPAGP